MSVASAHSTGPSGARTGRPTEPDLGVRPAGALLMLWKLRGTHTLRSGDIFWKGLYSAYPQIKSN